MNDALGLFLPVPELVLLAAAEIDLIVGELAAGERLAVGRGRLQIGGLWGRVCQAAYLESAAICWLNASGLNWLSRKNSR